MFCKKDYIPRKQVQDRSKKCLVNNNKRFLGKATGHSDNYMIDMWGQRPKRSLIAALRNRNHLQLQFIVKSSQEIVEI